MLHIVCGYLLSAVARKVEDKQTQHVDGDARDDEIDDKVESLSTDDDVERDVWVGLINTAGIEDDVFLRRYVHQIPFDAFVILVQLDSVQDVVQLGLLRRLPRVSNVDLCTHGKNRKRRISVRRKRGRGIE